MPTEYNEFKYDFRIDLPFNEWLQTKDDENWEFVATLPRDYSNLAWNHIIQCIFRRKV